MFGIIPFMLCFPLTYIFVQSKSSFEMIDSVAEKAEKDFDTILTNIV